jgi:F0F1-type ATP synthase membrane subunit b/b'
MASDYQLSSLGLVPALIIMVLYWLVWNGVRVFFSKYIEERAKNISDNVNLADQIKRMGEREFWGAPVKAAGTARPISG